MKKLVFAMVLTATTMFSAQADFKSPSGNIGCFSGGDKVSCFIIEVSKSTACPADTTPMFTLGSRGKVDTKCESGGDWAGGAVPTLAYGKTKKGQGWSCTSAKSGMTCKNNSGHGFKLSRTTQKVW